MVRIKIELLYDLCFRGITKTLTKLLNTFCKYKLILRLIHLSLFHRCPSYSSIPPYCHLEQKAGECCKKPVCEFDSQTGSFQGSGSISGYGVGKIPFCTIS